MNSHKERNDYAISLGATIEEGINWTWACGFKTQEDAQKFLIHFPEMESRGIYPGLSNGIRIFDVRFR